MKQYFKNGEPFSPPCSSGENLEQHLQRKRLDPIAQRHAVHKLALALKDLHDAKNVHMDVKP